MRHCGLVEFVGESAAPGRLGEITCRFEGATFGLGGEWSIKGCDLPQRAQSTRWPGPMP